MHVPRMARGHVIFGKKWALPWSKSSKWPDREVQKEAVRASTRACISVVSGRWARCAAHLHARQDAPASQSYLVGGRAVLSTCMQRRTRLHLSRRTCEGGSGAVVSTCMQRSIASKQGADWCGEGGRQCEHLPAFVSRLTADWWKSGGRAKRCAASSSPPLCEDSLHTRSSHCLHTVFTPRRALRRLPREHRPQSERRCRALWPSSRRPH